MPRSPWAPGRSSATPSSARTGSPPSVAASHGPSSARWPRRAGRSRTASPSGTCFSTGRPVERTVPAAPMHDVIVVGAGPVGLMLATLLAQGGADVLVLERRAERSPHSRAIGIHPPSLDAMAAIGVRDAVIAEGRRIPGGVGRCAGRDLGTLSFENVSRSHPYV